MVASALRQNARFFYTPGFCAVITEEEPFRGGARVAHHPLAVRRHPRVISNTFLIASLSSSSPETRILLFSLLPLWDD